MVQCFLFPGGNRVVARLDPTMRLISSSNLRNCFRPDTIDHGILLTKLNHYVSEVLPIIGSLVIDITDSSM